MISERLGIDYRKYELVEDSNELSDLNTLYLI